MAELFKDKHLKLKVLTQNYVEELTEIWTRIFDEDACRENFDKLTQHAESFYRDLVSESVEKEEYIKNDVSTLKTEADNLKRLLKIDFDVQITPHAPLLVVQSQLDKSLMELRETLRLRRDEIGALLQEQQLLCDELGEPPNQLLFDPLPTAEEILQFRQHLEMMNVERAQRLNKLATIRVEIKNFLHILELDATTETENRLLYQSQMKLNRETFTDLQRLHVRYGHQVQEMRESIISMKNKLQTLWERLEASPRTRNKFEKYTDYTQRTFNVLYGELNRCELLKSQNVKLYVQQIRQEILQWWDKTLKSEQQRSLFLNFYSNCYTDDLLVLHEMELEDLKTFYRTNKEMFELYADRKILWERMSALEAKASEPGRFNNRGGQLLKEEKERKVIATKLPKIEQQIAELVKQYEEREQTCFLVHGKNILDVMAEEWNQKQQQKEKQSNERKNAQTPISKSQLTVSRTPMSARKTPSANANLHKTPIFKRRKLNPSDEPTTSAKRSLLYAHSNSPSLFLKPTNAASGTSSRSPLKANRVLATIIRRKSGHHSSIAKRRRSVHRNGKKATQPPPHIVVTDVPNHDIDNDTMYDSFEECIVPSSRSSIIPDLQSGNSIIHTQQMRLDLPNENENLPNPRLRQEQLNHSPRSPNISGSGRKRLPINLPIII